MGKKNKKSTTASQSKKLNDEEYVIESFDDLNITNLKNVIRNNRYAQFLIILTIIAFILRFINITFNSLWLDEAETFRFASMSFGELWETMVGGERNPPLFYYLEHILISLFGNSEFVLRFTSAIVGSLSIPVFYLLGREIIGRFGGIITAAIIAFSSYHIFYSQEARAYALVLFFFAIAVLFYLYALKSGSIKHWIFCGVFCSLAFWTHMYVAIAIFAIFVHAVIVKRDVLFKNFDAIKQIISGILAFVIPSLPLLITTFILFIRQTGAGSPTWGLTGIDIVTITITQFSGYEQFLAVIFVILFLIGITYLIINKEKRNYAYLILISLILSFLGTFVFSTMSSISPRHLIFILPFYFVTIAAAFCFIPKDFDLRKVAIVIIIIVGLLSVPYLSTYYTSYTKENWRDFSVGLSELTVDGNYVITLPTYMSSPLNYYYNNSTDNTIEKGASSTAMLEEIEKERGNVTAYYIVTGDIYAVDTSGKSVEWLSGKTDYLGQYIGINLFKSKQ